MAPATGYPKGEMGLPNQSHPTRKSIRLDPEVYEDLSTICSVTIATMNRIPIFQRALLTEACASLLLSQASSTGVQLYANCFMPDHLHLLISPAEGVSIIDFVREFKGVSTRLSWEHGHRGRCWQQRFYDHFLRKDEDLRRAAEYILNNPVRKGLVGDWREYSYCGLLT